MKFSIIMPTHNHAGFIFDAIDSIRSQTYTNWELVIVNDGSTDQTHEIIEEYAKLDSRITVCHKLNGGTVSALNYALQKTNGDWIFWLSSDDLFEPIKLEVHYNFIAANKNVDFIHTNHKLLDNSNLKIYNSDFDVINFVGNSINQTIRLLELNYINGITISFSRLAFQEIGFFDYILRAGHDFDYWLRLSLKYKINYINQRLSTTRIHPGQDTAKSVSRGLFDSGISAFNILKFHPNLLFINSFNNESNQIDFLKSCLRVVLNKKSYINFCGFENYFMAHLSRWIKFNFDITSINILKSEIKKNPELNSLISFLSSDQDLDLKYISINSNPFKIINEMYSSNLIPDLDLKYEAKKYIASIHEHEFGFLNSNF